MKAGVIPLRSRWFWLAALIGWRLQQKKGRIIGPGKICGSDMKSSGGGIPGSGQIRDISHTLEATVLSRLPSMCESHQRLRAEIAFLQVHEGDRQQGPGSGPNKTRSRWKRTSQQQPAPWPRLRYRLAPGWR